MACVVKRRGKWTLDYYDQTGTRRWETTKGNKKEAELLLAQRLQEIDRLEFQSKSDQPLFDRLATDYIENRVKPEVRAITATEYEEVINRHILPYFQGRRVRTISMQDVEAFRAHMVSKGKAGTPNKKGTVRAFGARTVNKCLTLLSMMFNYALAHKWITTNPAEQVSKIKTATHAEQGDIKSKVLEPDEVKSLLENTDSRWRLMIKFAIYTGLRPAELFGLKWQDVDLQTGWVHVRRSYREDGEFYDAKTKAGHRRIPITGSLLTELKTWQNACPKGDDGLVFPNGTGKPESAGNLQNRGFYPALKRAGIRRVRFYDLRHTYASRLIANGESPKVVQALMGHSSIQVTFDIYGHLFKDSMQGVADRIEQAYGSNLVAIDVGDDAEESQVIDLYGGPCWTRTNDQGIMSPLL